VRTIWCVVAVVVVKRAAHLTGGIVQAFICTFELFRSAVLDLKSQGLKWARYKNQQSLAAGWLSLLVRGAGGFNERE